MLLPRVVESEPVDARGGGVDDCVDVNVVAGDHTVGIGVDFEIPRRAAAS